MRRHMISFIKGTALRRMLLETGGIGNSRSAESVHRHLYPKCAQVCTGVPIKARRCSLASTFEHPLALRCARLLQRGARVARILRVARAMITGFGIRIWIQPGQPRPRPPDLESASLRLVRISESRERE
jgi:hypothetical protein